MSNYSPSDAENLLFNATLHSDGPPQNRLGFLLVGHGTRRPAGQTQLRTVFADFAAHITPHPAALGFLELAEPDIPTGVAELASQGVTHLLTVPVLLFSAGHAERDIPEAVADAADQWGIKLLPQVPPLECCEPLLNLSALRFREAVCGAECLQPDRSQAVASEPATCSSGSSGHCSGQTCPKVAMLMLGRGSSSASATKAMRRFTELRVEKTRVPWNQTGFIHAQSPNVDEALDQLANCDLPLAVVQPHLLFEGELIDDLRKRVAERQAKQPQKRWIITETLGTDASLARTLADVALGCARDTFEQLSPPPPQ